MKGIVEMRYFFIHPINSKSELHQIISPDTEKINLVREQISNHNRSRHLDHNTDFDLFIVRYTFLLKLMLGFIQHSICGPYLINGGNKRVHELNLSVMAGAQYRTKLYLEQILTVQGYAYGSVAQKGIILLRKLEIIQMLITAYIQRAYDERSSCQLLGYAAIHLELLILPRKAVPIHIEKLRPK
ncbi:hypothetical protein D3C78_1336790 [compost metagenome]